jgi:single-stranded-DNA-specific exonuclease
LQYGGHFAAAGLSLLPEHVETFSTQFEAVVSRTITDDMLIPEIIIDASLAFEEINSNFFNIISQLEPFGPDNMRPVFIAKKVIDSGYSRLLKEKHIKFELKQDQFYCSGIGFNMPEKMEMLQSKKPLDIVFTLEENEWNGKKSIQLMVIDCRLSE